jgi:hypothetical protein
MPVSSFDEDNMTARYFFVLLLLIALAGCDQIDPYKRPGAWRPNGANDFNLRAMVAVPSDLAQATPADSGDGVLAAAAAARLRHDRVRPLLDSGLARIQPVSTGSAAPSAAAPPSGNGE